MRSQDSLAQLDLLMRNVAFERRRVQRLRTTYFAAPNDFVGPLVPPDVAEMRCHQNQATMVDAYLAGVGLAAL